MVQEYCPKCECEMSDDPLNYRSSICHKCGYVGKGIEMEKPPMPTPMPNPAEIAEAVELAKAYREMKTQEYSMMHIDPKSHPNRMITLLSALEAAEKERDAYRLASVGDFNKLQVAQAEGKEVDEYCADLIKQINALTARATRAEARCKELEKVLAWIGTESGIDGFGDIDFHERASEIADGEASANHYAEAVAQAVLETMAIGTKNNSAQL